MNVEYYLDRIGYTGSTLVSAATLSMLHECHVMSVPFEGIDIHLKKEIRLDIASIYNKVVVNNRGGYCYELNNLFFQLLRTIGFDCDIISSRIYNDEGEIGPEYDHMSIIVRLEENWLADVGYGDLFIRPLKIIDGVISRDRFKYYKINHLQSSQYLLAESKDGKDFRHRYQFDKEVKNIEDFRQQNHYKQYHKASYFVQNRICTKPTLDGRITLFNDKLIKRIGKHRIDAMINSEEAFYNSLRTNFDMNIIL